MKYALGNMLNGAGGLSKYDPDALAYITAVEAADAQVLEAGVKIAINNFVKGCKSDAIWDAIKASCILAGARTLSGALVPLRGTAPTNFNFVSGDYNRKTGLIGNGTTKYLNSNRNNNADPQNSKHLSVYLTSLPTVQTVALIGSGTQTGGSQVADVLGEFASRCNSSAGFTATGVNTSLGLSAANRSVSTTVGYRVNGVSYSIANTSTTPAISSTLVFSRVSPSSYTDARISFYSIGESIDLAALDSRVSTLMTNLTAAIP